MSNLVTFGQAKRLKKLGFNIPTRDYYEASGFLITQERSRFPLKEMCNSKLVTECSAPTVSEALDWIREKNGIECGVYPIMIPIRDGLKRMAYAHSAFDLNNNCKRLRLNISLVKIDTHHLASSALLYAVLTYLEQKEKK